MLEPALAVAALGEAQRRQRARGRLAGAEVDVVEEHLGDRRRVLAPQLPRSRAALGDGQPGVDVRRLELARVGEQDEHRLEPAGAREQLAEGGQLVGRMVGAVAVEDHDQLGRHQRHLAADARSDSAIRRSCSSRGRSSGSSSASSSAIDRAKRKRPGDVRVDALVRQPLPPLPRLGVLGREGRQQPQVVRRAPGGELVHQRARPRARALAIAGHGQHADAVEVDHHRLTAQRAPPLDELARLLERVRLVLGERVHPEVELDGPVERHRAGAEPDVQEVAMVGPALPHVGALDQQRPQAPRIGVQARQRPALELAGLGQLVVALAQVLGVAARLVGRALAHRALLRPAHAEREQQQQRDHRARDVQEQRVAGRRARSRPCRRRPRPGRGAG